MPHPVRVRPPRNTMNTDSVRSCRDRLWRPANVTVTFIFHKPRRISLQAEDPAAASGSGQITTESGSIHSLVWLLTYSAFLLPHNTASTLSEPGQSLIRFGCAPGSENELISLAAPAVLWASACPRHPGLGLGCPVVSKGCEASREWPSCCLRTTVSP